MVHPSLSLLFKGMPTLNRYKINAPLPLSPRASKQLLNLITESFRRQLDSEHSFKEFKPTPNVPHSSPQPGRQRRHSQSDNVRPTDRHLHSILTNPLFNLDARNPKSACERDPMETFDRAVALGMMNIQSATGCLIAKKLRIIESPILSVRQGMKESGAGLKVLRWLISSGTANDILFLRNERFGTILMEFMVAEGLQEIAWKWIKQGFDSIYHHTKLGGVERKEAGKDLIMPLLSLIKAEAREGQSLDAAYMCLSRAAGYLRGMNKGQTRTILGAPGRFCFRLTFEPKVGRKPPSELAFDSFLGLVPSYESVYEYHFARLYLIHPSRPSPDLALSYLSARDPPTEELQSSVPNRLPDLITLSLETASLLLDHGRHREAEWVMAYMRAHFPERLGLKLKEEQAKREALSLQMLDRLSLA